MRDDLHGAVEELDYVGNVEEVLIEAGEEEDFVFLDGTAEGGCALLLDAVRVESRSFRGDVRAWPSSGRLHWRNPQVHKGIGRAAEAAVADVIQAGAVPVIGAGLGDDVDDGAAGAS